MVEAFVTVAALESRAASDPLVYLLFGVAGILCGGAWSAYKADRKFVTLILIVLAAMAFAAATMWMIGAMR